MAQANKSRPSIPTHIKKHLLKEAGYGCVLCGCFIYDFEHIVNYAQNKTHDPEYMTILCPTCHRKVTNKQISKSTVLKAKESPFSRRNGTIHDNLCFPTAKAIFFNGAKFISNDIIVSIENKPLIWFEDSNHEIVPIKLCMVLYDDKNQLLLSIDRNNIQICTEGIDFEYKPRQKLSHASITISKNQETLFNMTYGEERIEINYLKMSYIGCKFKIAPGEIIVGKGSIRGDNFKGITLSSTAKYEACMSMLVYPKAQLILSKLPDLIKILNTSSNTLVGYIYKRYCLDELGYIRGSVDSNKKELFTLYNNEKIGYFETINPNGDVYLVAYSNTNDIDSTPILATNEAMIKGRKCFDVSYRIIANSKQYSILNGLIVYSRGNILFTKYHINNQCQYGICLSFFDIINQFQSTFELKEVTLRYMLNNKIYHVTQAELITGTSYSGFYKKDVTTIALTNHGDYMLIQDWSILNTKKDQCTKIEPKCIYTGCAYFLLEITEQKLLREIQHVELELIDYSNKILKTEIPVDEALASNIEFLLLNKRFEKPRNSKNIIFIN